MEKRNLSLQAAVVRLTGKVAVKLLSLRLAGPRPLLHPERISRILVFGIPSIGNTLLSVPMFVALRARFPDADIAVGYRERRAGGDILRSLGLVDKVLYLDAGRRFQVMIRNIRAVAFRPDIIIRPFFCVEVSTPVLLLTRARWRVGHVASDGWPGGHDNLLNLPVWMRPEQHESDRYLALARALGCSPVSGKPEFPIRPATHARVAEWLAGQGISSSDRVVSLHPGSSPGQTWKRWSMEKWHRLVDSLVRSGVRVIIHGDPSERDLVDLRRFAAGRVSSAVGIFELEATAALLNRSQLLVCNDSGLAHLMHYLGGQVIVLFGPTDAVRTGPVDGRTILSRNLPCQPCYGLAGDAGVMACGHHACLRDLEFEAVAEEVFNQLQPVKHAINGEV